MVSLGSYFRPVYRFEWSDGTSRRTDDPDFSTVPPTEAAVEELARIGRDDPECMVTLVGYDDV